MQTAAARSRVFQTSLGRVGRVGAGAVCVAWLSSAKHDRAVRGVNTVCCFVVIVVGLVGNRMGGSMKKRSLINNISI